MEEERWFRVLRGLNVLPIIVCSLIVIILIGNGVSKDFLLLRLPLFSVVVYPLVYFIETEESKNAKIAWVFAANLISTMWWLVEFTIFSTELLSVIHIMPILLSVFIVGYPLCMLYYNFKLFMNEISKPSWDADDADGSPLRCSNAD
ncbi:MAG: hypothetical protein ACOVO2_15845 [Emticicia sp.]|uniref:hypothetical protein n=1 Tax=Emticicia sp. TaxID=1930953 RepID=UPI003BA417E6